MTIFEFVFSLYSLLFGLALAQVFAGFGNTLQERHKIKVGWLTPLLGLFVMMDLTSFWATGWGMREMFRPDFLYLLCGVLVAGVYYLAARLVFPRNFVEWPDFDVYYSRHSQLVLGGILLCNVVAVTLLIAVGNPFMHSPLGLANNLTYFVPLIALLAVRNERANVALLLFLLARYAVFPLFVVLGVGINSKLF